MNYPKQGAYRGIYNPENIFISTGQRWLWLKGKHEGQSGDWIEPFDDLEKFYIYLGSFRWYVKLLQ